MMTEPLSDNTRSTTFIFNYKYIKNSWAKIFNNFNRYISDENISFSKNIRSDYELLSN